MCPSLSPVVRVTPLVVVPLASVPVCHRVLCRMFVVQQSVVKSTHVDFMELIPGSIFGARKVGTKSCSKM